MQLKRRGFLGTITAGLVGLVARFNPLEQIWTPEEAGHVAPMMARYGSLLQEEADLMAALIAEKADYSTTQYHVIDQVRYASGRPALVTLNDTAYRYVAGERIMKSSVVGKGAQTLESLASDLFSDVKNNIFGWRNTRRETVDLQAFAPISMELRRGVPFSADTEIAIGRHEPSGLTVRALGYVVDWKRHHGFELAPGFLRKG